MYSVVLMMAMTGPTEMPEFGRRGCHGCCGGYSSCHGCYGGYSSCHGCWGGSYSSGCWGGCYGSGWGGCYGSSYSSGYGCWGSSYSTGCYGSSSGHGCYGSSSGHGCYGSYSSGYGSAPGFTYAPAYGSTVQMAQTTASPVYLPGTTVASSDKAPGILIVTLPAEAKLTIDGQETKSTSGQRVFSTPPLEPGKVYQYTLKAEVPMDGKTEVITKVVQIQAGRETREKLELPAGVASAR